MMRGVRESLSRLRTAWQTRSEWGDMLTSLSTTGPWFLIP
jgi:hypothetical protein